MNSLWAQLEEVRRRDVRRKIFGASKHEYVSTPISAAEADRLESSLGAALPHNYRQFLQEVGHGAGPYYGLFKPSRVLTNIQCEAEDAKAKGKCFSLAAEFPVSANDLRAMESRLGSGEESPVINQEWPCSGCLPIGEQGCSFLSVLVLTGEFAGTVWDVEDGSITGTGAFQPARRPPGRLFSKARQLEPLPSPPTFEDWFAGWLEQCLDDFGGFWQCVGWIRRSFENGWRVRTDR